PGDVRLRRAARRADGARARPPAARRPRPGVRVAAGSARGAPEDRAPDAFVSAATEALRQSRVSRGAALARRALRIGRRCVMLSPRLLFASVERRVELRHDLALRSADEVA